MLKNRENNETEEIGLVTTTSGIGTGIFQKEEVITMTSLTIKDT